MISTNIVAIGAHDYTDPCAALPLAEILHSQRGFRSLVPAGWVAKITRKIIILEIVENLLLKAIAIT